MLTFGLTLTLLFCTSVAGQVDPSPSIVIDAGTIIGTTTSLPSTTAVVHKFLGIPFAQAPVEENRFLPPKALLKHDENPLNAIAWGNKCIAVTGSSDGPPESEDCLFLNVYTPAGAGCQTSGRPVLVWIHGGWLREGTASQPMFDGSRFAAEQGIVVVTFNYRLNVFGFPNSPQLPLENENLGFLDQRMALEWVQENINAFGGDPSKVTIAGESSGGSSVDRLVTTIHSNPPFRAAACSSGQATVSAIGRESGPLSWAALVSLLGCTGEDQIECVRAVDGKTIRDLIVANGLDFSPVNDNITQKELPYLPIRASGGVAPVPLLIGSTGQEGTYLAPAYGLNLSAVTEEMLTQVIGVFTGNDSDLISAIMQIIAVKQQMTGISLFGAAAQVYTEVVYQCTPLEPALLVSRVSSQSNIPTWRYFYNASFPNLAAEGYTSDELGASHGTDTAMIWGTYPQEGATDYQRELSRYLQKLWAGFIKDPSGKGPGWERVDADGNNIACIGCTGEVGELNLIASATVDGWCPTYEPFFGRVKTPFVKA
ncbi:Acylcarnitine hydrolase [Colletotrichum siamense]|uniref:Carboxylic ester hydrolase n=1 Tax=Colletotrichum siamense TaxID=690259 RepID=A0A9P5EY93_COLSI|nr:Acylcarnitine hydrolase [Colletotrichum siamense]KAF4862034.1 Acylcarnitine hydrolase [Colletotrichum siamense]